MFQKVSFLYRLAACVLSVCFLISFTACVDNTNKNPVVTIEIDPDTQNKGENGENLEGSIKIELYPEKAPNSVAYFLDFVTNGTYDDFGVSKVNAGHIVQFGDPWLSKHISTEIEGEFRENGFQQNDIEMKRGVVGLDLFVAGDNNSASGDFFIILSEEAAKSYDGKYAAIGEVISGMELLDQISRVKHYPTYEPVYSISTLKTTVDLKGQSYDKPVTRERRTYPGTNTGD